MNEIEQTLHGTQQALIARRSVHGSFVGKLSTSALSTATASIAFALAGRTEIALRARLWLCRNQNADGGWGDTVESPTNISTTVLAWACLGLEPEGEGAASDEIKAALGRAEQWLKGDCGDLRPETLVRTLRERYGSDQTFSVPILTACALTGRLGSGGPQADRDAWGLVPALPFELAACPHQVLGSLSLRVVSYALPALIAIGQVRHHHRPTRNPITRLLRNGLRKRTLRILAEIQPDGGGFLEAAPLTSFVAMSLISMGLVDHPVVVKGLAFLEATVREDGSWPIDTNLDTWLTSLSVVALDEKSTGDMSEQQQRTRDWLLAQQQREEHPYTHAAPGGWAWTDLSGGVPDADDTPATLLALRKFYNSGDQSDRTKILAAAERGVVWLLDLQNRDGGIPTFCRGWGRLPFDQSSPDLTAHALRAFAEWRDDLPAPVRSRIAKVMRAAVRYLTRTQRQDGAWVPLWFGNQDEPNQENPLYGTSRVLRAVTALQEIDMGALQADWNEAGRRAHAWLLAAQRSDGSFTACRDARSSIEETALALEALAEHGPASPAIDRAARWLTQRTSGGTVFEPSPIGLYFASLWYSEELYPLIWTASALRFALSCQDSGTEDREQGGSACTKTA